VSDWVTAAAVERQLTIIGEAVKRLTAGFRAATPDIDWSGWAGLRDVLAHRYDTVDYSAIRNTVQRELPDLHRAVRQQLDFPAGD
jgi:uncharacterized protein with HEPN domain